MARMLYHDRDPVEREWAARHLPSPGAVEVAVGVTFDGAVALLRTTVVDAVVADPADNELLALRSFVQQQQRPSRSSSSQRRAAKRS